MRTILFAYHDIGCTALRTLVEMGEEITAVFTHEDDPGENVWFGSVQKLAMELQVPCFTPENINTPEWIRRIEEMKPEILFSFYYRKLICEEILYLAPKGAYNLHGSLLPKFRGRAPVNWVLVHGEKETGITLHIMVKKPDAGDILAQKRVSIAPEDTAYTLYQKLVPLTKDLLLETLPLLRTGSFRRIPQNEKEATTFGRRNPEDGKINWNRSPIEIHNLVRAVTHPYPGAMTSLDGKTIYIWKTKPSVQNQKLLSPGTLLSLNPLIVSCGQGNLEIETLQMGADSELSGKEWIQKYKLNIGLKLGEKQS